MSDKAALTNNPIKTAFAGLIGTCLEYYDHFIFGTASALVFPTVIFSHHDPSIALILSLSSYSLAFVARPVGAAIFGHYGDRIGRKKVLFITLMLMGISTLLIGALPSSDSIGILAPILLIILRLAQGLALGGEWGGATIMISESGTNVKGFLGSFIQVASPIGFLLANLVFVCVDWGTTDEEFLAWGWRIPFLASAPLVFFGLYIRNFLEESAEFKELQSPDEHYSELPIREVLTQHRGKLAIAVGTRAGSDIAWYIFSLFLQVYLVRIGVSKSVALQAGIFGAITQVFAIPWFGHLSDRWGCRTILEIGAGAGILWAFVFFQMVDTKDPFQIITACMVGMFIQSALWAPLGTFLPELFPTHIRYTGAGLGFQLAGIAGGAFAPLIAIFLFDRFNESLPIAIYVAGALAFVLFAVAFVPRSNEP